MHIHSLFFTVSCYLPQFLGKRNHTIEHFIREDAYCSDKKCDTRIKLWGLKFSSLESDCHISHLYKYNT